MSQQKSTQNMAFFDHIEELRLRFMRCLMVFFLGFMLCYLISDPILAILRKPLFAVLPIDQRKLYFTSLFENFMTHLKIAGYASVFFFSPYYFYQFWGFLAPGLHSHERKWVIPFVTAASVFFMGGACFAYFILFPVGFKYFISYGSASDVPLITIDSYYSTCLKLLLLFGVAFELPVLICLLGYLGVVDSDYLKKNRRIAILGITVISALFAPPDAISMLILGIPLILMYEAAIWVVHLIGLRRKKQNPVAPEVPPHPWEGKSR